MEGEMKQWELKGPKFKLEGVSQKDRKYGGGRDQNMHMHVIRNSKTAYQKRNEDDEYC